MITRPVIRRTRSRGKTATTRKRKAEKEPQIEQGTEKKAAKKDDEKSEEKELKTANSPEKEDINKKDEVKAAKPRAKKRRGRVFEAALRPKKKEEEETYYLKDLKVIFAQGEKDKPARFVECVNFHKEDIFGNGGENVNKGFEGLPSIYLLPLWTKDREQANVTGFQLVASNTEDPTRPNLYAGIPGVFVYLVPTFDPNINERIIGLQLFRSRKFNPPRVGWANTTTNINEGRGGDHLCLQWDLGNEQDVPGRKFRFAWWRR